MSPQMRKVLAVLEKGPATSLEIQRKSGVLCYTKRISELRRRGYEIVAENEYTNGTRVVTYTLIGVPDER